MLVEGEGGIGKTRLVEELQALARRSRPGMVRITGTTAAGPGPAAPLALWTDALSDLVTLTSLPPDDLGWTADTGPGGARAGQRGDQPGRARPSPRRTAARPDPVV